MKTIAIMGLKGGVGKTTAAINIAAEMARRDERVLLIEISKQGNIGRFFHRIASITTADVLNDHRKIIQGIQDTNYENIDILQSGMDILTAKPPADALKIALNKVAHHYDYCIIDCEPTFDLTVITAIIAADKIYLPIRADQYSLDAAKELIKQVAQVDKNKIGGVFVNALGGSKTDQEALTNIKNAIEIMPVIINKSVQVEKMCWLNQPVSTLSPRCKATRQYADLTAEIIADLLFDMSDSDN